METNTVQILMDSVEDLTGLDNVSDAKVIRWLNYAADNYSYLAITSSGRWRWDSSNQDDMSRLTTIIDSSDTKVQLESDTISVQKVEILVNGKYQPIQPIDIKDDKSESLSSVYSVAGTPTKYDYDSHFLYIYPVSDSSRTLRVTTSRAHPRFTTDNLSQGVGVIPIQEEYIVLYTANKLMIGSNDPSVVSIKNELNEKKAEVRDLFSKRDQDTPRRLKGTVPNAFRGRSRPNK